MSILMHYRYNTGRRSIRLILALLAICAVMVPATTLLAQDFAIVGAKVYVDPETEIEGATVLVRNGRVRAVGRNVRVPAAVARIDGSGKVVTAGLIEASTRLGLVEVSMVAATQEGSFASDADKDSVHAAYRVLDGYHATSVAIPVTRTGGVTSAIVSPRGGLISGTGALVPLVDVMEAQSRVRSKASSAAPAGVQASSAPIREAVAMYVNLGEASLDTAHGSRGMALKRLRELLADAGLYRQRRAQYERNQVRTMAAERADLAALIPVLQGQMPLVVRAHRRSDILAALTLVRDFSVRLIIAGGTEAWMVAGELVRAGVGVIYDPSANLPQSFERIYARDDAAAIMADAGVMVAISSLGGAANARTLRQLAGIAVANGMTYEAALAAVTTVPALLFSVADRGHLRTGASADLVVWSGDPFELSTTVERVMIGGVQQSLRTRQTLLLDRYRGRAEPSSAISAGSD